MVNSMEEIEGTGKPARMLQCANCASMPPSTEHGKLPPTVHDVLDLKSGEVKKLSTLEALWLVLKGRNSPPAPGPPSLNFNKMCTETDVFLCSGCGNKFAKLIHVHQEFFSSTAQDSFVKRLAHDEENVPPPPPPRKMEAVQLILINSGVASSVNKSNPLSANATPLAKKVVRILSPPRPKSQTKLKTKEDTILGLRSKPADSMKRNTIGTESGAFLENNMDMEIDGNDNVDLNEEEQSSSNSDPPPKRKQKRKGNEDKKNLKRLRKTKSQRAGSCSRPTVRALEELQLFYY